MAEEQKVKRKPGRPRKYETEEERLQARRAKVNEYNAHRSRAGIVENAKNGIAVRPDKLKHFKTPEDLQESSKAIAEILYEASLPKVQSDEELYQRFVEYYQRCAESNRIPTVEECMLCTGYSYVMMAKIRSGECGTKWSTEKTPEIIAWAIEICRTYDAKMVMAGKLPQVPYIFRSKNLYGMKDQADVQVTHITEEKKTTLSDIAKRYGFETTFADEEGDNS